jgi:hypothetical protein
MTGARVHDPARGDWARSAAAVKRPRDHARGVWVGRTNTSKRERSQSNFRWPGHPVRTSIELRG